MIREDERTKNCCPAYGQQYMQVNAYSVLSYLHTKNFLISPNKDNKYCGIKMGMLKTIKLNKMTLNYTYYLSSQ